ncbi:MAG: ketoacyl-ACP synthase III [Verrucomicrobia bacterium]|nr:ketoacyl-ACP synthase III [Verrucomicrobiota bacterium]
MKKNTPRSPRPQLPPRAVSIVGTGSYLPERIVTNAEFEARKELATSDEWIRTRTGIRERRFARENEYASDLSAEAARRAMAQAGVKPEEIDLIIVATITPDMPFPATACLVQHKIGAKRAACFDLEAACSGFLYALEVGQQFVAAHTYNTVLVIGAEKLSSIIDMQDRNTCVLFGDGAGAAILRSRDDSSHGILTTCMGADGAYSDLLKMPGGGSCHPATRQTVDARLHFLQMAGKEVFKQAVTAMNSAATEALARCQITGADIALVIPHQANLRIIDALAKRIGVPADRIYVNLDRYGNTSAASVPIALDEAARAGRIKSGDLVLMVAFGAGFTWASCVIQW